MVSSDEKRHKSGTLESYPPPARDGRKVNELDSPSLPQRLEVEDSSPKHGHRIETLRGETGPQNLVADRTGGADLTTPEEGTQAYEEDKPQEVQRSEETLAPYPGESRAAQRDPAAIFSPGEIIEDTYRVLHVLGSGSMGVVYLAEDVSLKRKVAIKALAPSFQREEDVVEKFHREAVAMAKVRHPNVVQIYSFGRHAGHSYFVMEYVRGMSLGALVERNREEGEIMPLAEAVGLLSQVCRGVQAIHKQGIVHRDLKPANILLDEDYRVSVVDFGLVKNLESSNGRALELDGTPMYLAPERIRGTRMDPSQSHLCDIYSLGAIFYEVLTGSPPYESESVLSVLDSHLSEDPPDPLNQRPELPSSARWVICKAMAKDPSKRFQSCLEMEAALNDTRTGKIATSTPRRSTMEALTLPVFLVIEPSEECRESMVEALSGAYPEAKVYDCRDGEKGLQMALDMRPRLLVCYAEAPSKNALEICARLGSEPRGERPKILITDKTVDPLRQKLYRDLGAENLIKRRIPVEEFLTAVGELIPID